MSNFTYASQLQSSLDGKEFEADGTSTAGYDNDGSTGPELVENGWRLGRMCGPDDSIFWFSSDGVAHYFVGKSEADLIAQYKDAPPAEAHG